jgi:hypothetical protein
MSQLKLKQLQHESDTWKRSLGFMMDENIQLKTRLAEILRTEFDKNLLEDIENFQTNFIREDEMISLLKTDIAKLDKLLVREVFEDGQIVQNINRMLSEIRRNISSAENQFGKLKLEFNSYLLENLQ